MKIAAGQKHQGDQPGPADCRNVGTCVWAFVGACVGPERLGTSVGSAYRVYG